MHATRVKRTEAVSRSKGMSTLVVFSVQQRITHIAACETDPADAVYLPKSMTAQNPQELAAFLESLEDYVPTIPDELTQHYLKLCGFDCEDLRLTRLVSLAAQNFTASIINDSLQLQKQKMKAPKKVLKEQGYNLKDERLVLTMAEVAQALQEHGINAAQPAYYHADKTGQK